MDPISARLAALQAELEAATRKAQGLPPAPAAAPPPPPPRREGFLRRLERSITRFIVRTVAISAGVAVTLGPAFVVPGLLGWWALRFSAGVVRWVFAPRRPKAPPPPPDPRVLARRLAIRRFFGRVWLGLTVFGLACGAYIAWLAVNLPSVTQLETAANHLELLVDKKGEALELRQAIATLHVDLEDIPVYLRDALLSMEDRRFYQHPGVDYRGVARALSHLLKGRLDAGGSTITQQLAKNLGLSHDRTASRKLKELLLALKIDWFLTKDEILELYLNRIYFGNGANGIEAAARVYFAKRARELNVYESALLIGAVPSPERWNYLDNEEMARKRAELVLSQMEKLGKLKKRRKSGCCVQKGDRTWHRIDAVALLEAIRPEVLQHAGKAEGRLAIITSIDPDLQLYAELAVSRRLAAARGQNVSEAALVALAPDGAVRALVGAADRSRSTLNHATQTRRQLGSVFKPFVYLAALEAGLKPSDEVSGAKLEIDGWSPRNSDDKYPQSVTLTQALAASRNTSTVLLLLKAGREKVVAAAERLGLDARHPKGPAMALGAGEATLMSVTQAYVPFANGGRRVEPYLVLGIRNKMGRILYWRKPKALPSVVEAQHVASMNEMLTEVVYRGTGRKAAFGHHPLAGKTGTTQDERDAWFVGYSAHLAAGVWVGNDDFSPMKGVSGGALPAEIWRNFMANALESLRAQPQPLPGQESSGGKRR